MALPALPYRMLVADIDGTLLDSHGVLRPRVVDAVARARTAGLIVTLATGRRFVTARRIIEGLGLLSAPSADAPPALEDAMPPVVLQTGAIVVSADGSRVLSRQPLPGAAASRATTILMDLGLQPILYEDRIVDQRLFTGPKEADSPGATEYLSANPHLVVRMAYEQLAAVQNPLQIAVIGDREPLEAAIPYLQLAHCRTILSYSTNLDSYFMEVFHESCNKGRATAGLARELGFTIREVVAIGDNLNDIEMLAMAGCGLAVANAVPDVVPVARRRAPSNDDDAVAVVLDQLLEGREPGCDNPQFIDSAG